RDRLAPEVASRRDADVAQDGRVLTQGNQGQGRLGPAGDAGVSPDPLAHRAGVAELVAHGHVARPHRLLAQPITPTRSLAPPPTAAKGPRYAQSPVLAALGVAVAAGCAHALGTHDRCPGGGI